MTTSQKSKERFLVSKAWGFGFFSDVFCTLGHLLIAEITQRTPLIHWGKNSLFGHDQYENAFHQFFQPINDISLQSLQHDSFTFYPAKWSREHLLKDNHQQWDGDDSRMPGRLFLDRDEDIVVCDFFSSYKEIEEHIPSGSIWSKMNIQEAYLALIHKYINPATDVLNRVDKNAASLLGAQKILAVHFRGADKIYEITNSHQMREIVDFYLKTTHQTLKQHKLDCIYLMTDDDNALNEFKREFGDLVMYTDAKRTSGEKGIHYEHPGTETGMEVLVDALLAARCESFIGNGLSNPSCFVHCSKNWEGKSTLLGGNMLEVINKTLF